MLRLTLAGARVNAGFGTTEAAKLLGIGRTTLWKYEHGRIEPKHEIIEKMSELYRVPMEVLSY